MQDGVDVAGTSRRAADRTVLVIDDEAPIRLLMRVNLEAVGFRVLDAADGSSGLQLALGERPDLILLDVLMAPLSGWDVAEQLLDDRRTASTPIIFLTALGAFPERVEQSGIKGVEILVEPFNPLHVAPLVSDVLASGRGRLEAGSPRKLQQVWSAALRGERKSG